MVITLSIRFVNGRRTGKLLENVPGHVTPPDLIDPAVVELLNGLSCKGGLSRRPR
jgi:hypothetical protein